MRLKQAQFNAMICFKGSKKLWYRCEQYVIDVVGGDKGTASDVQGLQAASIYPLRQRLNW